jgi:glycosyltransferase involved in cell wall biosynthesis
MEQPLVSVITVTYNSERFIRDAIESILCQSYENLELVVCDDASRDNTWNIIQEYKDNRIRACRNETNIGEYPNRNKAIGMASGEYLIFIDGDDMMYPHGLEYLVKMMNAFPESGMSLMRWFENKFFYPLEITPEEFYQGVFFGKGFNDLAFANTFFRTKILKEAGSLSENYKAGDDYIRLKIAAKYKTLLVNDGFTWWRETPGQASQKLNEDVYYSVREIIDGKLAVLGHVACPLNELEKSQAKNNLRFFLKQSFFRLVKQLSFYKAFLLVVNNPLDAGLFQILFSKYISKDPFAKYNPAHPYKLDWNKNPYAKSLLYP